MPPRRRTKSDPSPLTRDELEAYAVSYLAKFDCTVARLRQVLHRKLEKNAAGPSNAPEAETSTVIGRPDVESIIQRFLEVGYLNDERFARGLAHSLFARGVAPRKAIERLRQRGVTSELAQRVIEESAQSGETELVSAARLVRRKRLGWCRSDETLRKERAQRDLAVLARAGFSFDVARRALARPVDDVD
jgi:regulatory protein